MRSWIQGRPVLLHSRCYADLVVVLVGGGFCSVRTVSGADGNAARSCEPFVERRGGRGALRAEQGERPDLGLVAVPIFGPGVVGPESVDPQPTATRPSRPTPSPQPARI